MKSRQYFLWLALAWAFTFPVLAQIVTQPPMPEWLQHPSAGPNQTNYFRKTFQVQLPMLKAILLGACERRMQVTLNGQPVGEIAGRDRAISLDLTRLIRDGENVLSLAVHNSSGPAKFSALLELNGDFAKQRWIPSDASWEASPQSSMESPLSALSLGRVDAGENPFDPKRAFDAYNSWKLALGTNTATDPATFTLPPGFKVELLRSAQPNEGSWVSMAFDPEGRLTVARERRGLLRFTLGSNQVEHAEVIEDTLLECRGLLYLHGALYVNANNSKGFYRLRDKDQDGRFEEVQLLLRTEGGVGHGRNHVVAGPNGSIYLVHGNNVTLPPNISSNSPLRSYQNDALIPCPFDDAMFDGDVTLPAGHILRTDAEGKSFELVAGGFRNPLDIAFNREGEMFTFDADMEWDVGAPWYRPNRINHVIPGADFGWRRGTAKWPDYFPDTLPSTLDIGLASPTGIEFGTDSHFPAPFQDALYVADWAYGRVLAVHLKPKGATYTASSELFMSGRPLNVTDLTFGPDGAMYLITGGRTTQSGLYRISHSNRRKQPQANPTETLAENTRALRRQLETLQTSPQSPQETLEKVWPYLGYPDVFVRHAARVALEQLESGFWQSKAFSENQLERMLTALLTLVRVGDRSVQDPLLQKLNLLSLDSLTPTQQLQVLRIYGLACSRMGRPSASQAAAIREKLEAGFPTADWRVNHQLCAMLVYLNSPQVISKTLSLIAQTDKSEDLLHYLFHLRYVSEGWTTPQRASFLQALDKAEKKPGARDYYTVLKRVREDFTKSLTAAERQDLEPLLLRARPAALKLNTNSVPGSILKEWQVKDFDLSQGLGTRPSTKGKAAFTKAQCHVCHRLGNEGGLVGPDLSAIGSRFDLRTLLESIIEPSKVIDEKFHTILFELKDGSNLTGMVESEDQNKVVIRENAFADSSTTISKQNIARREPSKVSPMPAGLINGLSRDEILDLLALLSAANGK